MANNKLQMTDMDFGLQVQRSIDTGWPCLSRAASLSAMAYHPTELRTNLCSYMSSPFAICHFIRASGENDLVSV
jgi:hypothetical protein